MPHRIPAKLFDKVARLCGYVPATEMAAALAEKEKLEGELRHKNANLRSNIYLRDRLEKEVEFLRRLELAHANKESGTQQAVERIDAITDRLLEFMQSVWPEAHDLHFSLEADQPADDTKETAAA